MRDDITRAGTPLVLAKTKRGWHATEQISLPGAHVLRFDTYSHRTGRLVTEVRIHSTEVPGCGPVTLDAMPSCASEALAASTLTRRTRAAVARQHFRVVTAHVGRLRDAACARLRLHGGPGPAFDAALAALPPGDMIAVRAAADEACERAAHATIVAALSAGFGLTDEIGDAYPLVAMVNGRRMFIAADRAKLADLAAAPAVRAWRTPAPEALQRLRVVHEQYANWCQGERKDVTSMVALGHPDAGHYLRLRRFFDRLAFACGATTRRVAWRGDDERADFSGPTLDVSRYPTGLPEIGHSYPGAADWEAYIALAAATGWADGCGPRLDGGTWYVRTQRPELLTALEALRAGLDDSARRIRIERDSIVIRLGGGPSAPALHARVLRLVRLHQRDGLLPRLQPDTDAGTCARASLPATLPTGVAAAGEAPHADSVPGNPLTGLAQRAPRRATI